MRRWAKRRWDLWCTWLELRRAKNDLTELDFRESKGFCVTSLERVLADGELLTATNAYNELRGIDAEGN